MTSLDEDDELAHSSVVPAGSGELQLAAEDPLPPTREAPLESAMDRIHRLVDLVATGTLSIILQGETGVGKEVLAKRIHQQSARANCQFLKINCAAFSETMVESELFGHERGAFTGAEQAKAGLLEAASGGTVLLDELAELSLPLQAKLLRAIGNSEVIRVGGLNPRPIDVRFVAATNGDFNDLIERGAFRSDLYFRLNGISLTIPPLRERVSEILPLARKFLAESPPRQRVARRKFSVRALHWLTRYTWPGNIRELRSVVERAVLLAGAATIDVEHLQLAPDLCLGALRTPGNRPVGARQGLLPERELPGEQAAPENATNGSKNLREQVEHFERQRILAAIARCGGNQTKAADALGLSRRALMYRMDVYGLPRPRKGPTS